MDFFNGFSWNNLKKKAMPVPYKIKQKENEKKINENLEKFLKKERKENEINKISKIVNWDAEF